MSVIALQLRWLRPARLRVALLALLIPLTTVAHAVVLENLYLARIETSDHGAGGLKQATTDGLRQVLIKVSGSDAVLQDEEVNRALPRAEEYLQQYQYLRGDDDALYLEIRYDQKLVNDLLILSQQPLWTANRPPVLVWLVVDDAQARHFGTAETHPELITALVEKFDLRGVPLRFPLYDLQDSMALSVNAVWRMEPMAVRAAAARYEASDVLVGRFTITSVGDWLGEWSYFWSDGNQSTNSQRAQLDVVAAAGANLVAEAMADRYAIAASAQVGGGVLMRVDGILNYGDYRTTLRFLQGIELIETAYLEYVQGSTAVFRLRAQADARQLEPVIALHRRLAPRPALGLLPVETTDAELVFQWQP